MNTQLLTNTNFTYEYYSLLKNNPHHSRIMPITLKTTNYLWNTYFYLKKKFTFARHNTWCTDFVRRRKAVRWSGKTVLWKALKIPFGIKTCSFKSTHNTRWYKNCSLKIRTIPGGIRTVLWNILTIPGGINTVLWDICTIPGGMKLFSARHTHNTGWYEYILPTQQRGRWNPGGLVLYQASGATSILAESRPVSRGFQGGQRRRQSSSPGVIPGRMGQWWSKRMAVQFQGVPGGVACGTIPGKAATSWSTPVGSRRRWCDWQSVVYTRVAWETAITKSNLAFVYNWSLPDSVYTRSLSRFCLYQVIARLCLRKGWWDLNHTSVRGAASAWAAGTLP